MWRMYSGDRVLNDAEWEFFADSMDLLRDFIECDIKGSGGAFDVGVSAFDQLTPEQKLILLADVAAALREPAVPMPRHTAVNEAAIMAVLSMGWQRVVSEIQDGEPNQTRVREGLLRTFDGFDDRPLRMPRPRSMRMSAWEALHECLVERILWDYHFEWGDEFLDLPPDEAKAKMAFYAIHPDYFLATVPEPNARDLNAARQTLARLLGLPIPNDRGQYEVFVDHYHDLYVGPVLPGTPLPDSPWLGYVEQTDPRYECDVENWLREFCPALPDAPFWDVALVGDPEPPAHVRFERVTAGWVVADEAGFYWRDPLVGVWTDEDDDSLVFPTEDAARAAFARAKRFYAERSVRHDAALARIAALRAARPS